jgi:hypothetical protein
LLRAVRQARMYSVSGSSSKARRGKNTAKKDPKIFVETLEKKEIGPRIG